MGRSINYPDGSTLTTTAYTASPAGGTIGTFLHPIIMGMLGLVYDVNSPLVRFTWPMLGAPYQDLNDDIMYVSCVIRDDPYDKIRDREQTTPGGPTAVDNTEIWTYTRCWTIRFCAYGPNALDNLRAIKSALFQPLFVYQLNAGQLFSIPDSVAPSRTPEMHNAQWWERADMAIDMYEFVTETIQRQTILSCDVLVQTAADLIVTPPVYPPPAFVDGGPFQPVPPAPGFELPSLDGGAF